MPNAISLEPTLAKADRAAVNSIAQETSTSVDIVEALYEAEVTALAEHAKVRQFVGVIATRRVKQQLRHLAQTQH
jgi:Protein of unknown function (DUF3562)